MKTNDNYGKILIFIRKYQVVRFQLKELYIVPYDVKYIDFRIKLFITIDALYACNAQKYIKNIFERNGMAFLNTFKYDFIKAFL